MRNDLRAGLVGCGSVSQRGILPRYQHWYDIDAFVELFVRELTVGIGDSGVRAGVIKVGNSREGIWMNAVANMVIAGNTVGLNAIKASPSPTRSELTQISPRTANFMRIDTTLPPEVGETMLLPPLGEGARSITRPFN